MTRKYTSIVRKSKLEYVAVCLDLNVSARGVDLADVEKNLLSAIELYLQDTEPEWHKETSEGFLLRPFEVHEVPAYV